MIPLLLDHLWQSTVFAAAGGVLTLAFTHNSAAVRHWLWFAASVKFLIPFSALTALGAILFQTFASPASSAFFTDMQPATEPFSGTAPLLSSPATHGLNWAPALLALWALGFAIIVAVWLGRWVRLRAEIAGASSLPMDAPMPVKSSVASLEPGLVGIWRPVLLLPQGITAHLSPSEMQTIVAHEICHLRRHDNLLAAIHMGVEALFWFHPLVWWLGGRLIMERENACDEAVLACGSDPQTYAKSILKVCQFYMHSPLACASGVSGADLKRRMETIMENKFSLRLNVAKKILLAGAATIAIGVPVAAGLLASPPVLAQPGPTSTANTPDPAEEAALRRLLEGIYAGNPPYDIMTPASADVLRAQWSGTSQISKDMGALSSLTFQMTQGDFHVYAAVYQHGRANWIVGPHANRQLDKVIIDSIRILGTPRPGTQDAARRYIEAMQKGQPNYADMTPAMASIEQKSADKISAQLKSWGALKSLAYESSTLMGPAGGRKTSRFAPPESFDVYKAEFENRTTELIIDLAANGKIAMCLIKSN